MERHDPQRSRRLTRLLLSTAATAGAPQGAGVAWDIVVDLATEIGARLAGSPREAAARAARGKRLGVG